MFLAYWDVLLVSSCRLLSAEGAFCYLALSVSFWDSHFVIFFTVFLKNSICLSVSFPYLR